MKGFEHMPALVAHRKACGSFHAKAAASESATGAMLAHRTEVLAADQGRHVFVSLKVNASSATGGDPTVSLVLEHSYHISVNINVIIQRSAFSCNIAEFSSVSFTIQDISKRSPLARLAARPSAPSTAESKPVLAPRQGGALKRKRYDNNEKANAIHFYDECVATAVVSPLGYAAKHCGIPIANLSAWANGVRDNAKVPWRDVIFKSAADSKLKSLTVTSKYEDSYARYPLMEAELAVEVRSRRARGRKVGPRFLSVRGKQLQKKHYPNDTKGFAAGQHWRVNYMRRMCFRRRKRTHKKSQSYASMGRFLFRNRFNVDQVPLPFVVGDFEHTVDEKGAKDVWIRQPGSGLEKRQATLQICIRAGKTPEGKNCWM
ncbi:hypothetical protein CYMTET_21107 [Cymbomonas tetramitiformis]|uniref:Uncharacterized protein n=1 Tax=Cymbomonas tetramitiformis TaxID=36881 RepID=A0AAE0L377_9CHLO|nr:hypothetical protein CYMTET_21107 [Cymbomonas tetramitiformis]